MCIPRWCAKGHSAFAAAASSRVLSCPTARRKLSVHPSPPSPSPAQPFFPLLPRIFTSYLLSLTSFLSSFPQHHPLVSHSSLSQLACGGAEGCSVTFCPSTPPLPYSPLISYRRQVTLARNTHATITFPFSAAPSPRFYLMEIVGKKNLLLLSKSYQIFIRVIL